MVTNKDIQALNEFLENREVDYVLTGTAALFYHGMLPEGTEVHDIDIIVLTTEETRPALQAMFKERKTFLVVITKMNTIRSQFMCSK